MKTLKYILSASISLVFLTACNDSFLEKYPETELNEEAFFRSLEEGKEGLQYVSIQNKTKTGR